MMQSNFKITKPLVDPWDGFFAVALRRIDKNGEFSHWGCQFCKEKTETYYYSWGASPYAEANAAMCNCKSAKRYGIHHTEIKPLLYNNTYKHFIK